MGLSTPRCIVAALAVVALGVAALVFVGLHETITGDLTSATPTITTPDGVQLSALLITPDRPGDHPLVVMPASFGANANLYTVFGKELAESGYDVVAYAQRGGGDSTGKIDYAGAASQRDASTVITWALKHTDADPRRIGMLGVSYGGGISLLAAERDPRIRAVVALSTWTDLGGVNVRNGTLATQQALQVLGDPADLARLDAGTSKLLKLVETDPSAAVARFGQLSSARSPITDVARLNANKTAVMISNGYEDSIMPSGQLQRFYDALTTPKRLQLAPGDHLAPEISGFYGQPNDVTASARRWLDHFLLGKINGIDTEPPIQLKDSTTGMWHGYRSWPADDITLDLGDPGSGGGVLETTPSVWQSGIVAGTDTVATSGPPSAATSADYEPATAQLSTPVTLNGITWYGQATDAAMLVSGTPRLTLSLGSNTGQLTLFAYLYDVAASGAAKLMSMAPVTTTGQPGASTPATLPMQPISWTVPAGDRLALVVDTVDPRFTSSNTAGDTVTISSVAGVAATLDLPVAG